MHTRFLSNPKPDAESGVEWNEVVRLTVEAFRHRSEGRERQAMLVLQDRLPAAIRAWSVACDDSPESCKERLRAMFARVRTHVATEMLQRRILLETSFRGASDSVQAAQGGKFGLTERIRIDDVSRMLDALADAESECAALRPADEFQSPRLTVSF